MSTAEKDIKQRHNTATYF